MKKTRKNTNWYAKEDVPHPRQGIVFLATHDAMALLGLVYWDGVGLVYDHEPEKYIDDDDWTHWALVPDYPPEWEDIIP